MQIYTIGFTKKNAETFFGLITDNGIGRLLDIRLNPRGQLAGFTKSDDLAFFLRRLADCEYHHLLDLAPTEQILADYRKDHDWEIYTGRFNELLTQREIPASLERAFFETRRCCLLCSESEPEYCHRRLVAERLAQDWPEVEIIHLR